MKTRVVLTGADGNMGREALYELASLADITVRILLLDTVGGRRFAKRAQKKLGGRVEEVFGDIADMNVCRRLVEGADYVINCAAVIPPKSDKYPDDSVRCNYDGVVNLIAAIKEHGSKARLIHISSVAVYGNRNYLHPWGRVGDPLLPSVYDVYAATKVRAERLVIESGLPYWAVLRQTAILHDRMLTDNLGDGLMFHTCFNTPLEWVTAKDSGYLMRRIIEKDTAGSNVGFWRRVFNIGGGAENRKTGYDTFNEGFGIIGGSAEKFMKPGWNAIRNFHGLWFYDGRELNDMFGYVRQSVSDYWREILEKHGIYRLAKILPPSVIGKLAIEPLLKDDNAPQRWIDNGEAGRVRAFFGSAENVSMRPERWEDYYVVAKGRLSDGTIDYERLKDITEAEKSGLLLSHGYDETKPDEDLDIEDMAQAAEFRGGRCLSRSMTRGDLYTPLEWECCFGHRFFATPYAVLKAGHWCPDCQAPAWDFDRQAARSPFYAQVYYDSHAKGERYRYYFDGEHRAVVEQSEVI